MGRLNPTVEEVFWKGFNLFQGRKGDKISGDRMNPLIDESSDTEGSLLSEEFP